MILLANIITGPLFSSFVISPPQRVFSSYGSKRNGGGHREMFYLLKIGAKSFGDQVEVRTFVRIQKVIWEHLLASEKEASFSFACGTPRGE